MKPLPQKKGSLSLYLLLLVVAVATMIMLRQCSARTIPPRSEAIAGGDTINVAIEISPMGATMVGDTLGGVYYDMLRRAAALHGRQLKFHPFTQLDYALQGLDKGRYQIVVSDIPATAALKEKYIFVDPVGIDRQVLVQRRDTTLEADTALITTQLGLAGKEVTVPQGSPYISRLINLSHEIGDTIYIRQDKDYSSEQLIVLTALGEVERAVVSERVVRPFLLRYPQLDASLAISFNQFHGWALAPADSALRDTISTWLN